MTTDTLDQAETGPEMEDIVDFIRDNELTMHVLLAHETPYRAKDQQGGAVHWSCKLVNAKNQHIVIYFSKGIGIRRWCQPPETGLGDTIPLHVPHDQINQPYDGPQPPFENEHDKRTYNLCSTVEPPLLIEVLDVLAKDVWLIERAGTYETWVHLLKVNPDSRIARKAYEVIVQQRIELMALFGEDAYHKLLYEIDRINPIEITESVPDAEIVPDSDKEST